MNYLFFYKSLKYKKIMFAFRLIDWPYIRKKNTDVSSLNSIAKLIMVMNMSYVWIVSIAKCEMCLATYSLLDDV